MPVRKTMLPQQPGMNQRQAVCQCNFVTRLFQIEWPMVTVQSHTKPTMVNLEWEIGWNKFVLVLRHTTTQVKLCGALLEGDIELEEGSHERRPVRRQMLKVPGPKGRRIEVVRLLQINHSDFPYWYVSRIRDSFEKDHMEKVKYSPAPMDFEGHWSNTQWESRFESFNIVWTSECQHEFEFEDVEHVNVHKDKDSRLLLRLIIYMFVLLEMKLKFAHFWWAMEADRRCG